MGKFSAYMASMLADPKDGVTLPMVDVDMAAEKLGHVVVR